MAEDFIQILERVEKLEKDNYEFQLERRDTKEKLLKMSETLDKIYTLLVGNFNEGGVLQKIRDNTTIITVLKADIEALKTGKTDKIAIAEIITKVDTISATVNTHSTDKMVSRKVLYICMAAVPVVWNVLFSLGKFVYALITKTP